MKFHWFHLMPYPHLPDDFKQRYPSVWVDPPAAELPHMVEDAVTSVQGVREVKVNLVWDPPWDPSRMSDEARAVLNMW